MWWLTSNRIQEVEAGGLLQAPTMPMLHEFQASLNYRMRIALNNKILTKNHTKRGHRLQPVSHHGLHSKILVLRKGRSVGWRSCAGEMNGSMVKSMCCSIPSNPVRWLTITCKSSSKGGSKTQASLGTCTHIHTQILNRKNKYF